MSGNRAGKIFFVVSFLALGLAVLGSAQTPILRDYPDWVYQGVLLAKLLTGHPVAGYALKFYPVPNSLTTVSLGLLTVVFGWVLAAKLWVVISLAFAAFTGLYTGKVLDVKDGGLWWVLPATLFLGQLFWFGTISFNIGLCLLLLIACALYRERERTGLFVLLLVACFFVHLIVYASALVMILLYCMQHRRWKLAYVGLATTPLAAWYFAGRLLTHSNESEHGYSAASHIAVPCLAAALVLTFGLLKGRLSIQRIFGPILVGLALLGAGAAIVTALLPSSHLSARLVADIFLLHLKALQPFTLFGFVDITYTQIDEHLYSATLHLFRAPVFLLLMALAACVALGILFDLARRLLARSFNTPPMHEADSTGFLWDFITLFGLIYVFCPPNGMGVISLDMRMAQIGLAPALFLLAKRPRTMLRLASLPCALLMAASIYQYVVSQQQIHLPETRLDLPHVVTYFGAVNPIVLLPEYDTIRSGQLDHLIFDTGIFIQTSPPLPGAQSGQPK